MGEEANCNALMEAKENGNGHAVAVPDVKAKTDDAVVAAPAEVADPRLQGISDAIRVVPHFPKQGIMFNDITTLLLRPGVFKDAVDIFVERYRGMAIAAVAGKEHTRALSLRPEFLLPCTSMHVAVASGRAVWLQCREIP
jgi:adenine phosphoribosyltransferase